MRTYNADGTQKINSDCAEKNSRNVSSMFDEKKREKTAKLKLIRYKSHAQQSEE